MENKKLSLVELNVDSIQVILMLKNRSLYYDSIIDLFRFVLRRIGSPQVVHYYREQDYVADALAKMEQQPEVLAILTTSQFLLCIPLTMCEQTS